MPAEEIDLSSKGEILTFAEIEKLASLFIELGIRKIRLTGGEPLVRRGIESLCESLAAISGLESLGITTNGVLLEKKAAALKQAGVREVNVSLDTLQPGRFRKITLRRNYSAVRKGILAALEARFQSVKINTVVIKGFNDDELLNFVDFAVSHSLNLRFIEYMPFLGNLWSQAKCLSYGDMKSIVESKYKLTPIGPTDTLHGPARDFRIDQTQATLGFITTMSENTCATCNRLRLTADGKLRNCLFSQSECDLKTLLRKDADEHRIKRAIIATTNLKWENRPKVEELLQIQNRTMRAIGG
jgi:cyclic pyranopterin phosphate synthase